MKMAFFYCTGWHTFRNNRQICSFYEVPTITHTSPHVVLGK